MTPATYLITDVSTVKAGESDCFRVTFLRDDGLLHGYLFPAETLTWRAAELGLDPQGDLDQLLDIVLHEPFVVNEPARPQQPHLARIAEVKSRITIRAHPALVADPLDVIRRHRVTPERVRAIHDLAQRVRPPEPPADESAVLRHEMS